MNGDISQIQDFNKIVTNLHADVQRKLKYLEEHQKEVDLGSDNVKVDFLVLLGMKLLH